MPVGYPKLFEREISLGASARRFIVERLQQMALKAAETEPICVVPIACVGLAPPPVTNACASAADEDNGILGAGFNAPRPPPPRFQFQATGPLVDIPAEYLCTLGQPRCIVTLGEQPGSDRAVGVLYSVPVLPRPPFDASFKDALGPTVPFQPREAIPALPVAAGPAPVLPVAAGPPSSLPPGAGKPPLPPVRAKRGRPRKVVLPQPAPQPSSAPQPSPAPQPSSAPQSSPAQAPKPSVITMGLHPLTHELAEGPAAQLLPLPIPAHALPDPGPIPLPPQEDGDLPLFPDRAEDEEELDPFKNFASQPENLEEWLMQISSTLPDANAHANADDSEGSAKRARTAQE